MADNTVRGRFVWHELETPNGAGAHAFYGQTLGWKTQGWEHDPSYSMFVASSGPLGAAVEKKTGTPQWLAYIGTPDVAATIDTAVRLGGKVLTPLTVLPNAGTHAVLADPQGATFAVHSSTTPARPEQPAGVGEFSWHELATTVAPTDAFGYYAALFGWDDLGRVDMGSMGVYLLFGRNGRQLGGMFNKGAMGSPGAAYWLSYVRVTNLEDAMAKAKAARGTLLNGPMDVPGGDRIAQLMDPHGALFAVHMVAADAKSAAAPKTAAAAAPPPAAKAPVRPKPKAAKPAPRPLPKKPAAKPAKAKKKSKKKPAAKKMGKKKAPKKKAAKKAAPRRAAKKKRVATKKKRGAAKKKPAARRGKSKKAKRR